MINKIIYWQGYINYLSNNSIVNNELIGMSYISNGSIRLVGRSQSDMIRNYGVINRVNNDIDTVGNVLRRSNLRLNTERPRTNIEENRYQPYYSNSTPINTSNIFNPISQPRIGFQYIRSNGIDNLFGGGLLRNLLSSITNFGTDVRVVLSEQTFNRLRKSKYRDLENNLKEMNNMCNLTLQEFLPDNEIVVLPCNHVFNYEPIKEWLTNHSNKCPVCRHEIEGPRRYVDEDNEDIIENVE